MFRGLETWFIFFPAPRMTELAPATFKNPLVNIGIQTVSSQLSMVSSNSPSPSGPRMTASFLFGRKFLDHQSKQNHSEAPLKLKCGSGDFSIRKSPGSLAICCPGRSTESGKRFPILTRIPCAGKRVARQSEVSSTPIIPRAAAERKECRCWWGSSIFQNNKTAGV